MLFELAALTGPLLSLRELAKRAEAWVTAADAKGSYLGCWRTELGRLGQVLVLRGYDHPEDMTAERRRALMSADPFDAGDLLTSLEMDSYAAFPFLPPARTGERGGIYEIRTYRLAPGGLAATLAGWEAAIAPARPYTDHLVTAMYALDGAPRITHVWAFGSLAERADLRGQAYAAGVWPPKGAPEQIAEATSTVALPEGSSPLR